MRSRATPGAAVSGAPDGCYDGAYINICCFQLYFITGRDAAYNFSRYAAARVSRHDQETADTFLRRYRKIRY